MRVQNVFCGACQEQHEIYVDDDEYIWRCECGQRLSVPIGGRRITGRCALCNEPIDIHELDSEGRILRCPKV